MTGTRRSVVGPPRGRLAGTGAAAAALAVLFALTCLVLAPTSAAFTAATGSTGNAAGASTLTGPASLTTNPSAVVCRIRLDWSSASTPVWASGYRIYRSANAEGPFTTVLATVTPQSAVTYNDESGLQSSRTYYYQIRSFLSGTSWGSAASATASGVAPALCPL